MTNTQQDQQTRATAVVTCGTYMQQMQRHCERVTTAVSERSAPVVLCFLCTTAIIIRCLEEREKWYSALIYDIYPSSRSHQVGLRAFFLRKSCTFLLYVHSTTALYQTERGRQLFVCFARFLTHSKTRWGYNMIYIIWWYCCCCGIYVSYD